MTAVAHALALTRCDLLRLARQPVFIFVSLVQPVIWLLLFGELFRRVADIPGFDGADFKEYIVPGVIVMTAFFSGCWNGMATIDDLARGVTDRLLVTPVRRVALIAGRVGQNLAYAVVQSTIMIALALAAGVTFDGGPLGVAVLVAAACLLGTALSALSNGLALVTQREESLIGAVTFLQLPLMFMSTAFMQADLMPDWMRTLAQLNPVEWAIVAGREAAGGGTDWGAVAGRVALLAAFALGCIALATRAFRAYQARA